MSFKCEDAWSDRRTSGLGLLHDVLELSEAVELPGQVLELGLARLEVQLQVQRRARLNRARRRKRLGSPVWSQRGVLENNVKNQRNDDVKKYQVVKVLHMVVRCCDRQEVALSSYLMEALYISHVKILLYVNMKPVHF